MVKACHPRHLDMKAEMHNEIYKVVVSLKVTVNPGPAELTVT